MPYTYILDDSIKSPTLIVKADHSTLLFLPGFFLQNKELFFLLWVNLYIITDTYLHEPRPFNGPFLMTPPFSTGSKSCDPASVTLPLFFVTTFIPIPPQVYIYAKKKKKNHRHFNTTQVS